MDSSSCVDAFRRSASTDEFWDAYESCGSSINATTPTTCCDLIREGFFFKAPRGQRDVLRSVTLVAIVVVFFLHLVLAAAFALGWKASLPSHLFHVLAVWLALFALAARAFEEGLQPGASSSAMSTIARRSIA